MAQQMEQQQQRNQQGTQQQQMGKLAELQKQIINATWKLRRQQGTAVMSMPVPAKEQTPKRIF